MSDLHTSPTQRLARLITEWVELAGDAAWHEAKGTMEIRRKGGMPLDGLFLTAVAEWEEEVLTTLAHRLRDRGHDLSETAQRLRSPETMNVLRIRAAAFLDISREILAPYDTSRDDFDGHDD